MRCEVKNCKNNNKNKSKTSFFSFPSDSKLLKQWIKFCGTTIINTKNARVCMKHFKADDFENRMEHETGFATKLYLNRNAAPTICKIYDDNNDRPKMRAQRAHKRENKKRVQQLIKDHDAASAMHCVSEEETETLVHPKESEALVERLINEQEYDKEVADGDDKNEIHKLKNKMKRLRKENFDLRKSCKRIICELEEKRLKGQKIFEYKVKTLKTCLDQNSLELKNFQEKLLGILTKEQIAKLKQESSAQSWLKLSYIWVTINKNT